MNHPTMRSGQLARLWRLRERLGPLYGSEDLSLFFYTLARREKWANIVELGTGLGVCTVWLARAVKDNGRGHVHSVDDGSHFRSLPAPVRRRVLRAVSVGTDRALGYEQYLKRIDRMAGVADRITHYDQHLDLDRLEQLSAKRLPFLASPIDMLFSDFNHGRDAIVAILRRFLPSMSRHGSVFIDGASTHLPSRRLLDRLVSQLNRAHVPGYLTDGMPPTRRRRLEALVTTSRVTLVHLVEQKRHAQNSTAWLQMEPADRWLKPSSLTH